MARSGNALPRLGKGTGDLPRTLQTQLENAKANWSYIYGGIARFDEYSPLGVIDSEESRKEVLQWLYGRSRLLTGNLLAQETLRTVEPALIEAPAEERAAYEQFLQEKVAVGDLVVELRWTD